MKPILDLLDIMKALRDPDTGCPWDRQQTMKTIVPYTLEEVYELVETVESGDMEELKGELGDLLFHLVFYSRFAEESGHFSFSDVIEGINRKLIRRHPHVFGTAEDRAAGSQPGLWEQIKAAEKGNSGQGRLDGISPALPALIHASKLQQGAAGVGFDWTEMGPVLDKIEEEIREIRHELAQGQDRVRMQDEIGDLLFACVNFARHAGVEAETALMSTNRKFKKRFAYIEAELERQGLSFDDVSLEQMEALWEESKTGR